MDAVRPVDAEPGGRVRLVFGPDGYRVEPDRRPLAATLNVLGILANLAAALGSCRFVVMAAVMLAAGHWATAVLLAVGAAGCAAILGVFAVVGRITSVADLVSDGGAYVSFGRALVARRSRPGAKRGITWHAPG